jgi:uncharacterized protein YjdB
MKTRHSLILASLLVALAGGVGCTGTNTTTSTGGTSGGEPTSEGKAISSVDITPNKATLSKGTTLQYHATAHYADGTTEDVTRSADTVWNTSAPTVATVSKSGLVTAIKEGFADITADFKGEKAQEHFVVTP